ncbi:MAG: cellulase family glycosylhydrolase [Sedimentisphaerales bacterium]
MKLALPMARIAEIDIIRLDVRMFADNETIETAIYAIYREPAMDRRDFLKTSGVFAAASLVGLKAGAAAAPEKPSMSFSRYRGVNLLAKFGEWGPRAKFEEEDFEIMAEWGFDFARIPMSYWRWASKDNWFKIDEEVIKDIDEVVALGKKYKIHINLNLHRIPGYCINDRKKEPVDIYEDTPENMQKAMEGAIFHWKLFAKRYKGIPNSQLSFDLINEPPFTKEETRHVQVVTALVKAIREEDPARLIVSDGKDAGRTPIFGIADLGVVQSTRGYTPMSVTHYQANWVGKGAFESSGVPTWPLKADNGKVWDKAVLKEKLIDTWVPLVKMGVPVHVGEWGCYNKTPHDVVLAWMKDVLSLWKEVGWGHAMWNLRGDFGVLDSGRTDIQYENYKGHKLDRKMFELLKEY